MYFFIRWNSSLTLPSSPHPIDSNPVVAAYGTAHEIEFSGRVPTLEWDVFLDPYLVRRVEIVLSEKEAFLERQKDARKRAREAKEAAGGEDNDHFLDEEDVTLVSASDERLVLSYYDKEIKRRTTLLVERMLIAHGNIVQLVMEHFCTSSYLKKYNFSRVKRTRKTLGGGIFARQWLSVYSEAMKLGMVSILVSYPYTLLTICSHFSHILSLPSLRAMTKTMMVWMMM